MGLTISIPNGATLTTALTAPASISSVVNGVATINSSTLSPAVIELYVGVPGSKAIISTIPPLSYDEATQTLSLDTSGFLLKSGNLAGLADVSVARSNLSVYSKGEIDGFLSSYLTITAAAATYYPLSNPAGYISGVAWGSITGTLSAQTDLQTALNAKYDASNPSGYQTASQVTAYVATNPLGSAIAANNLSDLTSPSSARTNLGVYSTSETDLAISTALGAYLPLAGGTMTGTLDMGAQTVQGASGTKSYSISVDQIVISDSSNGSVVTIAAGVVSVYNPDDGSIDITTSNGLRFTDNTYQTTAFIPANWSPIARALPSGGVVNQALFKASSTDYDTTWRTVDIYSTTSTTTLTVAKTTQTLTVGTYLGYTPLQDVTIAATADPTNQHMHGLVTSYNQTTGVMVVDVKSKTGSGTYSAWTVNIGGIGSNVVPPDGATGTVLGKASSTDYDLAWVTRLDPANNLSDVSNTATARTNLSVYSISAVDTALGLKANLASPTFTGVPAAPTAVVDTNTTQLATTAYVVGQAGTATPIVNGTGAVGTSLRYARQDHVHPTDTSRLAAASNLSDLGNAATARTNLGLGTIAVKNTASTADMIAATDSTKAPTLDQLRFITMNGRFRELSNLTTTGITGSGAVTSFGSGREMYTNATLSAGRATYNSAVYGFTWGAMTSAADVFKIDFSKACMICGTAQTGGTYNSTNYIGDSNTVCRVNFGGRSAAATGDLTQKGIGWKKVGGASSNIFLTVHNGTALTNVDSGIAIPAGTAFTYVVYSDGTGNVYLYLNGSLAASTSAGPTGTTTSGYNVYEEQVEATASATVRQLMQTTAQKLWIAF